MKKKETIPFFFLKKPKLSQSFITCLKVFLFYLSKNTKNNLYNFYEQKIY